VSSNAITTGHMLSRKIAGIVAGCLHGTSAKSQQPRVCRKHPARVEHRIRSRLRSWRVTRDTATTPQTARRKCRPCRLHFLRCNHARLRSYDRAHVILAAQLQLSHSPWTATFRSLLLRTFCTTYRHSLAPHIIYTAFRCYTYLLSPLLSALLVMSIFLRVSFGFVSSVPYS